MPSLYIANSLKGILNNVHFNRVPCRPACTFSSLISFLAIFNGVYRIDFTTADIRDNKSFIFLRVLRKSHKIRLALLTAPVAPLASLASAIALTYKLAANKKA